MRVALTSAWREKRQGRHLGYGSHLCPRQVLRKTLHGTQSSQQLKRTVEKGKSYFMHQIENILSKSFQKNSSKVISFSEHRVPNTCSADKAKVQRGSGCESKRQKFMQTSLCAASYPGFHRLIHKVPHYKVNESTSNWFLEGSAYDFPNLSQQLPMTGEWRGHVFVGDIKQGTRKQRKKN